MAHPLKDILAELAMGRTPSSIDEEMDLAEELNRLVHYLSTLQHFATSMAKGDLSQELDLPGPMAGALKKMQSNLRQLTWQTRQIAAGDFTQRIDFMGDFSKAFNSMVEGFEEANKELSYLGTHDSLTGLYNRSFFNTELERLRKGRSFPIGFILADLRRLKKINDRYGRTTGDFLLQKAALLISGGLRADDILARVGGGEFSVILPRTDLKTIQPIVLRLEKALAEQIPGETPVAFTMGTAVAERESDIEEALKEAEDQILAKKKNRKEPDSAG